MLSGEPELLMRECWRKFWIMCWLFMGSVLYCVVGDMVSGEYDVQCSGLLDMGLCDVYGDWRHSRNVCV